MNRRDRLEEGMAGFSNADDQRNELDVLRRENARLRVDPGGRLTLSYPQRPA